MRTVLRVLAIGLVAVLAGCGQASTDAPTDAQLMIAALRAFRVGDPPAFAHAKESVAKAFPEPTVAPNPCSHEDTVQRRANAFNGLLTALDSEGGAGAGERQRYDHLQAALLDSGFGGGEQQNTSRCQTSPGGAMEMMADTTERVEVLKQARDILVAWRFDLGLTTEEPTQ
jgi:hypothetical protein